MEYQIRHNLKKDSFAVVEGMRIQSVEKSCMKIPLCRLIHMPLDRPLVRKDKDLMSLSGCMFFVYDGNHRLLAWNDCIELDHNDDALWYVWEHAKTKKSGLAGLSA